MRIREGDGEQPRRATWMEVFFDLVFVVAVAQLGHALSQNLSWAGVLTYVALFTPFWWAWIGATVYANRFDSDDVGRRILTGLQMLAVAAMAVNVHHGLGEGSLGFALGYGATRWLLVLEYLRAGWHIPEARRLTTHYSLGFSLAALLWTLSVFIPSPWRFALWGTGVFIDLLTPLTAQKHQRTLLPHSDHLPERFGLFTIIVLGEAIIAVVNGVAEVDWEWVSSLSAVGGG